VGRAPATPFEINVRDSRYAAGRPIGRDLSEGDGMTDGGQHVENSPPASGELPLAPTDDTASRPKNGGAQREFRIAVVMTGGVSLCVWMGGTAYELDRLRRKDGIYGK